MLSFDDVYVTCDNCDIKINTDNHQIFCLYTGEQSKPDNELTICENCNFDLIFLLLSVKALHRFLFYLGILIDFENLFMN